VAANVGTGGVCLIILSSIRVITNSSNAGTEGVWANHREPAESPEYNSRL